ncbi:MAG: S-layer homology domain-containing protein [Oscillibacter sp.]|nr:S-layer homology domain-containing protein [Oscillibacter sp.]
MKKFLALVLALVMTMSLVTISAGAEDFTDDSKITYDEAVDVMTAIGVVGGYADGSFNPQGTLTRGAAAKIICNMILGPTAAGALATVEAPFKDVPADHVFSGYIAYCASEGIVGGYTDGTFKPAGTLTGYAFMKMLLGALGYDALTEGYTGANFAINVAKRALNIGLDKGLTSDFVGTKALTREEACLYAFNALNAQMVEYDNNSTITIGDVVISNNSKAEGKFLADGTTKVLFRDEYFKNLDKKANSGNNVDVFGRPAHTWYTSKTKQNADTKIGTYADAADYTVVAEKAYGGVVSAYVDLVDDKYVAGPTPTVVVNGGGSAAIALGDTVEFFMNDTTDKISTAVITRYSIAKIEEVSTKLTKAQKEDGATAKFRIGSAWYLDNKVEGFDAETYVKDAYILYVPGTTGTMIASEIAESFEGEVTAKKGAKVAVDGVYYNTSVALNVGDEGTFYLGKAGELKSFSGVSVKSDNYGFIYNLLKNTSGKDEDGNTTTVYTAYYVKADGTKASAVVKTEVNAGTYYFDDGKSGQTAAWALPTSDATNVGVVAFSIDADGKFVREVEKDVIEASTSATINKGAANIGTGINATSATQFIFLKDANGKVKPSVITGYKNVAATTATMYAVTNSSDEALYVFVDALNGKVSVDAKLAVVLDNVAVEGKDADGAATYTYAVAIGDEEATLTFAASQSFTKGQVIAYELDNDDVATIDSSVTINTGSVATVTADYIVVGTTQYNIGEETAYTIDMEYKADAVTLESVTVSEGATYVKTAGNNTIYYTLDGTALDTVYVVNNIK